MGDGYLEEARMRALFHHFTDRDERPHKHLCIRGLLLAAVALGTACTQTGQNNEKPPPPKGDGFAAAYTIDAQTLILSFQRKVKAESVQAGAFTIFDRTVIPAVSLSVDAASPSGDAEVTLTTGPQEAGRTYTLTI